MDALSDVLRALRLSGTVYFRADFQAPWGMAMQAGQFANFHLVVRGECWVTTPGCENALELGPGDIVVFPRGDAHSIVEKPDAAADPAKSLLATGRQEAGTRIFGGDGQRTTTMICGHFEYDRDGAHPLFDHLPEMIHLKSDGQRSWIESASQLTELESGSARQGSSAIVDRLAEVLLIQVLRAYLERTDDPKGFLGALSNPGLSRALLAIHQAPSRPWTVEAAAKLAGMSRSVFSQRFRDAVGMSPIQYVARWRMLRARELLVSTQQSLAEIAAAVGYESEFAFAKAFKKSYGESPGALRRQRAG